MSVKAKAIKTLYRAKRITIDGVKQAVIDGIITAEEYMIITGNTFTDTSTINTTYYLDSSNTIV